MFLLNNVFYFKNNSLHKFHVGSNVKDATQRTDFDKTVPSQSKWKTVRPSHQQDVVSVEMYTLDFNKAQPIFLATRRDSEFALPSVTLSRDNVQFSAPVHPETWLIL
jgi:hypothetical protein